MHKLKLPSLRYLLRSVFQACGPSQFQSPSPGKTIQETGVQWNGLPLPPQMCYRRKQDTGVLLQTQYSFPSMVAQQKVSRRCMIMTQQ